jgi:hypothetical protein
MDLANVEIIKVGVLNDQFNSKDGNGHYFQALLTTSK